MSVNELDHLQPDLEGTDEKELHDLVERANMIEEMTQHPGWAFYVDYLRSLTTKTQTMILSGRCDTHEEYRAKTGYVGGLRSAMEAPRVLLERVARLQAEREIG